MKGSGFNIELVPASETGSGKLTGLVSTMELWTRIARSLGALGGK